jgi:diguanylate cyclase (GGDEF)-like protein
MILPTDDPAEILKQKAMIPILGIMALGGIVVTILHAFEVNPHPISLGIAPGTTILCFSLLIYLIKHPQQINRVVKIILGWSCLIIVVPEYFFVLEALLNQEKLLIDTLPPISSGIFILTTFMAVFLRHQGLDRLVILLWVVIAAPIVVYLLCHPQELETARGIDLIATLFPAMAINLYLVRFYLNLQDATIKLAIQRSQLQEVSEKDALTGVFNRGAGERILQNLIDQTEQSMGIILCDIDRFKQINDTYGHLMGDRVLRTIVRCCQTYLRKKDIFIRWGGEEFLIVVPGGDRQELAQLAERFRSIIAEEQIPEVGRVTASFGVALLGSRETLSQLFTRADQALYTAKNLGRNQVVIA